MPAADSDFRRLEDKVDRLTEAITQLVRVEERQLNQGQQLVVIDARLTKQDDRITDLDRSLSRWVNRGVGAWALAVTAWTIYLAFRPTP